MTSYIVVVLSGCGGLVFTGASGTATLVATPSAVDFGTVSIGNSANQKVSVSNTGLDAVEISQLTLSNQAFSVDGEGTLPVKLAAGKSLSFKVHFNPKDSTDLTGQLSVMTSASSNPAAQVKLHGKGSASTLAPTISALSCGTSSFTGAGTTTCTVSLSSAATSPTTVSLTSSNAALTVPATVVVATGVTTAGFNAVSSAVGSTVAVTITGTTGGVTSTDVITLYPPSAAVATLSGISCGTQTLTGPTTTACSVNLSAAATSPTVVTLSSSSNSLTVPASVTVATGASSAGLNATASAVTTTTTITLTATAGGVSQIAVIQLEGTGSPAPAQHQVQLNWDAPSAPSDPLVGYNVYRSTPTAPTYQLLNSSVDANTTYTDTAVQSGQTYDYYVTSVDSSGVESAPSNMTSATIP